MFLVDKKYLLGKTINEYNERRTISMLIYENDVEQSTCDSGLSLDERLDIARQRSEKTIKPVGTESDDFVLEIEV